MYVSNWNGKDNRYAICQTNDEKRIKTNYGECWTRFYSTKSLDDFEKENCSYLEYKLPNSQQEELKLLESKGFKKHSVELCKKI